MAKYQMRLKTKIKSKLRRLLRGRSLNIVICSESAAYDELMLRYISRWCLAGGRIGMLCLFDFYLPRISRTDFEVYWDGKSPKQRAYIEYCAWIVRLALGS